MSFEWKSERRRRQWRTLVEQAERAGIGVEVVEFCEDHQTPGLLGMADGLYSKRFKLIKLRRDLPEPRRIAVLRHELKHVGGWKDNGEHGVIL